MSLNRYDQFFNSQNQYGSGPVSDFGNIYKRGGVYYQSGRGINTLFTGILRLLKPILLKTGRALGEEAIRSSGQILNNLDKRPLRDLLREQKDLSIQNLMSKAETGLKGMTFGRGLKSTINRPASSMESLTFYSRPARKRTRSRSVSTRRKSSTKKRTRSQSRRRTIKKKKVVKKAVRKVKTKTASKLKADFLAKYLPK